MSMTNDVYVMALDAVDLNWLPISQKHRAGGTVPLWSKSNLGSRRNEYYEFVIKTDDTREDRIEPVIENVICHICDINVPKGYLKEHKNGFRHKFNRKVADTALKRIQLYMDKEDINEFNEKLPSKHFCTECSIVIDSEDETSHKQTTGHRNSLFLERFLNDFLNFYTNDDNEIKKDDTRKDIKTEIVKESTNSEKDFVSAEPIITETVLTNIKKETIETENVKETKDDENCKTISDLDEQNVDSSPLCDLQEGEVMFQIVDGSTVNAFKVTGSYYQAFVEISATSEYCMICNHMYIKENRSLHVCSDFHIKNSHDKPLDKNCVRKIYSSHYHCALCNDYFTEYDLHVNSKEHLTNFRNKMIIYECDKPAQDNNCDKDQKDDNSKEYSDVSKSDENKSSTDTNQNTAPEDKETSVSLAPNTSSSVPIHPTLFCDTCNVWISTELFQKHKNTTTHTFNEMSDYHYLMKSLDKENLICRICRVTVSNAIDDITEHFTCVRHLKKYTQLLKAHGIIRKYYKKYYCRECKVYMLHKNEYLHMKSKEHGDKVRISETGEINKHCDNVTGSVGGDATGAVALVDSNTVGGGLGNATDIVQVNATDNEQVNATDNVQVNATDNVQVNATGNVQVNATDNEQVNATDNVQVNATDNVQVNATDNEQVNATDNVQVNATDNVQVNATDNVTALETVNQVDIVKLKLALREIISNLSSTCDEWLTNIGEVGESDEPVHPVENVITALDNENTVVNCYICDVCKVKVPNNDYNIAEHNRGRSHMLNLETYVPRY